MKKALCFIFMYFVLLIVGTALGSLVYSLYMNVINFTAGRPLELFKTTDLIKSFFYVNSCYAFLICPILCYYRARHTSGTLQIIAYIIIFAFTWLIVFPMTVKLKNFVEQYYFSKGGAVEAPQGLTGGYFRTVDGKIYYLVEDYNFDRVTRVIEFDTEADEEATYKVVFSDEDFELLSAGKPYKDVIIKSTFVDSSIPNLITLKSLVKYGEDSLNKGFIAYLCFLSLALAIFGVYGVSSLFDWNLLNVCSIIFTVLVILIFNSIYFSSAFDAVREQIYKVGFFSFINRFIEHSFLVVLNFITAFILIGMGFLNLIVKKSESKRRGD
ncbi:MAG: hypothetical protein K6C98_10195 [Treponema sp.]|nr:hypothetical protein [Treponema sp.]